MRATKAIGIFALPVFAYAFAGCAPEVAIDSGNAHEGVDQQFVESGECSEATMPASGCLDWTSLKLQAYDACVQQGKELVGFVINDDAGCDNTTSASADYQCCHVEPAAPPEMEGCTVTTLPDAGCLDYGDLKMQAYAACQQAGLELFGIYIKPVDGCDNVTSGAADYQCCAKPPVQDVPPPDICANGTVGDGTCQTYDVLKTAAWDACLQSNFKLYDLTIDTGSCADGLATSMTYSCISGGACP